MHPCGCAVESFGDLVQGVARAGVDIPGLETNDRRTLNRRDLPRDDPPLSVNADPHHPISAKAEHAQGLQQTHVHFVAHDDRDGWRPEKTVALDIPALALK